MAFRDVPGPMAVLGVGAALTGVLVVLQVLDVAGMEQAFEILHWNVAALAATVAAFLAARTATGMVRRVRLASALGLLSWLASNVMFAVLTAFDAVTIPSVADLLAAGFVLPGAWALVTSVRGRLSRADEAAIYLDDALLFSAIAAALVTVAGDQAYVASGLGGLAVIIFPAVFVGAGLAALVTLLADRSPMSDIGGFLTGMGALCIGLAYTAWAVPSALGRPVDSPLDVLFSAGPLLAGLGVITWSERGGSRVPWTIPARMASWAVGPAALIAVLVCALASQPTEGPVRATLDILVAIAVALLVARFALHIVERGQAVSALQIARAENDVLIARLRAELDAHGRSTERLVDASRMAAVGELAAAIAHEVNNPLTSVLGYADLLLSELSADDDRRADLEVIRTEAIRVRDRVRSLLDFAAPRRTILVAADLATVVAAPLELLRYHLGRSGITIVVRSEPMSEVGVDPGAIQQVLVNVITELAAAMPGGGRIDILTRPEGDHAAILIEPERTDIDIERLTAWLVPPNDHAHGEPAAIGRNASVGLLRGHDGTIGTRRQGSGRAQIAITVPFHRDALAPVAAGEHPRADILG